MRPTDKPHGVKRGRDEKSGEQKDKQDLAGNSSNAVPGARSLGHSLIDGSQLNGCKAAACLGRPTDCMVEGVRSGD